MLSHDNIKKNTSFDLGFEKIVFSHSHYANEKTHLLKYFGKFCRAKRNHEQLKRSEVVSMFGNFVVKLSAGNDFFEKLEVRVFHFYLFGCEKNY